MLDRCDDSASRIGIFRDGAKLDASYAGLRSALNASLMKSVSAASPVRLPAPVLSKRVTLDDDWFQENFANAHWGMDKLGLDGRFELRFAVDQPLERTLDVLRTAATHAAKSKAGEQLDILRLDRASPRPTEDGLVAEMSAENVDFGGSAYDYWALKTNGDFFLLQRLAEDYQADHKLWFDASIVRAAAGLLFASTLYDKLGVKPHATLMMRTTYRGLNGRILGSGNDPVHLFTGYRTEVNQWQSEIRVPLHRLSGNLVDDVKALVAPMFMRFNFAEFDDVKYASIIKRHLNR